MLRLLLVLSLLLPRAAVAEIMLGYATSFNTRFGRVEEAQFGEEKGLLFHGRRVPGVSAFYAVAVLYGIGVPGEQVDWLLVQPAMGGNACAPGVQILRITPNGATASEVFGECSEPPFAMRVLRGKVEVDIAEIEDDLPYRTYSFDGASLTNVGHVAEPERSAIVPPLESWAGRLPADFLGSKQGADAILRFAGGNDLEALGSAMGTAQPMVVRQGWLMAAGCSRWDCGGLRGGFAVRLADGALAAIVWERDAGVRFMGNATGEVDVQALMSAIPLR